MTDVDQRRRVLDQPSPEKEGRAGCLTVGAILGVIVGIMVGLYALPPILKGLYGEKRIDAGETYRGDAKVITVTEVGRPSAPLGEVSSPDLRRDDIFVAVTMASNKTWAPELGDWTIEVEDVEDWIEAVDATTDGAPGLRAPLGEEVVVELHFVVERPREAGQLELVALHLAEPRVRFALEP